MDNNMYISYGYESSFKEKAKLIKENGFDGVFVFENEYLDEMIKASVEANLKVETIHLSFEYANSIWVEGNLGEEQTKLVIEGIRKAGLYGIKIVIMHLDRKKDLPPYSELGLSRIKKMLEEAKKWNVFLAIENIRRLDYIDYVFENISSPYLKLCFDCGHASAFTKNIKTFPFEKYKDKIVCVHLHDNDGESDLHKIPFSEKIDYKNDVINKLKSINYSGNITIEAVNKNHLDLDEKEFVRQVKCAALKLRSLYEES